MTITGVGLALIAVGFAIAWGNAGIPPYGFRPFRGLLAEYRSAKAEGTKPSLDAQGAYCTLVRYQIGGGTAAFGAAIWLFGFILGR